MSAFPGHDDRWTDLSLEAIAQRQRDQRRFLAELEAIDSSELDADAQLDRELIQKASRGTSRDFNFIQSIWPSTSSGASSRKFRS